MEIVTKKHLIDLIKNIDEKLESLLSKLKERDREIAELKIQNKSLKENNQATLSQIKEYIQELEQIRNHYVNSNNNTK